MKLSDMGGTVLVDGTSKWILCKINDAESLEGKTVAEIIANTLGQVPEGVSVSVTAGTIGHGGTIPLPSGYNRSQCKYSVWWGAFPSASYGDVPCPYSCYELSVNQSTGIVSSRSGGDDWYKWKSITAGYLCVSVK